MINAIERTKPSLFGLFTNPIREFRLIQKQPRFFLSLLLLSLIMSMILSNVGKTFGSNPELISNIERLNGQTFPPELKANASELIGMAYGLAGFLIPWIACLLNTIVLLLLVRAYRGKATFKQLYAFTAHLYLLTTLALIADFLVHQLVGRPLVAPVTSLGILFPDITSGILHLLFRYISLFTIWYGIWLIVGLQEIAGLSKQHAKMVAVLFLLIGFFGLTNVTLDYQGLMMMVR